jgi:hypothetical protein
VAALLDRGQLILEMDARRAGADHALHQLMRVQHPAETGFGVADDRQEIVHEILVPRPDAAGALNFVGALEGVVDALDHQRHRIDRIQRLVGIHRHIGVVVGGDLPAGQIDGLDAGLGLLHRLPAGQRAQAVDVGLVVISFHRFSAPRCARLYSTGILPRSRTTSSAV